MTSLSSVLRAIAAPAMLACALAATSTAAAQDYVRFTTNGAQCGFDSFGQPLTGAPATGGHRDGSIAALNNQTGSLAVSGYGEGWHSAQWVLTPSGEPRQVTGTTLTEQDYLISNLWTRELLVAYQSTTADTIAIAAVAPDFLVPDYTPGAGSPDGRRQSRPLSAQETIWTIVVTQAEPGTTARDRPEYDKLGPTVRIFQKKFRVDRPGDVHLGSEACEATFAKSSKLWRMKKTGAVPPPEKAWVWLHPRGEKNSIHVETGTPGIGAIQEGWHSAMWEMKEIPPRNVAGLPAGNGQPVFFVNRWTGKAMAINAARTGLEMIDAPAIDAQGSLSNASAVWRMFPGASGATLQNGDKYIGVEKDALILTTKSSPIWLIDGANPVAAVVAPPPPVETYVRLELSGGQALNIETGAPNATPADPGWWSAQWVETELRGFNDERFMFYRNRWTNKYLSVGGGQLVMIDEVPLTSGLAPNVNPMSWQWVGGGPNGEFSLRHTVTGQYLHGGKSGAKLDPAANGARVWIAKPVP